jgi:serine/threonine-protein kinase
VSDPEGAEPGQASSDAPTLAEPASMRRPPVERTVDTQRDTEGPARGTTILSPRETLVLEEVRRTRSFSFISLSLSTVICAALPFVKGDRTAKWVVAAGMAIIAASAAYIAIVFRDERAYTVRRALVYGWASVFGGYAAIYFFGTFSPAVAVMPMGLYFFSVGGNLPATLAITGACMLLELVLAGGIVAGFIPDHGIVRADGIGIVERGVIIGLVEATYLATFMIARMSRKAMVEALERHAAAQRVLAQREALLKEARQEIERALQLGGIGRFSEERIGSFRLGVLIGRGGMGEVYEATHVETGAPAAVKLMHRQALSDPGFLRRFVREAKIASSLDVPYVVRVLEIGDLDAQVPYIAMERLRGHDLAHELRTHRRLHMKQVHRLVREVGRGLDAARAAGIVHRDIKPQNLFWAELPGRERVWKILDFGVSTLIGDDGGLTRDAVVGTPLYMAPEQGRGLRVDHRADLFALGVITYRALTGRPAFTGDAMADVLFRVAFSMPPRPGELVNMPEDVDLVLAIAMAKKPEDRFDSGAELADALDAATRGELSPDLRERAARLLAALPWGQGA